MVEITCRFLILCLYCICMTAGEAVLEPREGSARLGTQFNFTVNFSDTDTVTGRLLLFKKVKMGLSLCHLNISSGEVFIYVLGYNCGATSKPGKYFLQIQNVSLDDAVTWKTQYGDMLSNSATLDVTYPPAVEIQSVPPCPSYTYVEGETNVTLNCTVLSANPAPTVFTWQHNNMEIGQGQHYVIRTVTRSSKGLYRCTADNGEAQHGEDTVTVTVHYPPTVTVPYQTEIVNESSNLDIPCTAEAKLIVISVVWTKKDVKAQPTQNNGVLQLRNLQREDSGTYICTATNTVRGCNKGDQNKPLTREVNVHVQYAPLITSFGIYSKVNKSQVTVEEHAEVHFICKVDSLQGGDITILKDGTKKNHTQRDVSLPYGIRKTDCQDGGNYTCTARNILGKVSSHNVELFVKCAPRLVDPKSERQIFTANLNGTATVRLTVLAYPRPTFELRQSKKEPVLANAANPTWVDLQATGTFTLNNIQEEMFTSYIITVISEEKTKDFRIFLRQKSEPDIPLNFDVSYVNSHSMTLVWEKGFNGGAEQNFPVDYRPEGGVWVTHPIILSEDDGLALDLNDLEPSTSYEIRLTATNKYGSGDPIYVHKKTNGAFLMVIATGIGVGVAIMSLITGICLMVIFRRQKAARRTGYQVNQGTVRSQESVDPEEDGQEEGDNDMPRNLNEVSGEIYPPPLNSCEQLVIHQNKIPIEPCVSTNYVFSM